MSVTKVWVGSLSDEVSPDDLRKLFGPFGAIDDLFLQDRCEHHWALVTFREASSAESAIRTLNRVSPATRFYQRSGGGPLATGPAPDDVAAFVGRAAAARTGEELFDVVRRHRELWARAWSQQQRLDQPSVFSLVVALSRLSESAQSDFDPPPLAACCAALRRVVGSGATAAEDVQRVVGTVQNALKRLAGFVWREERGVVRQELLGVMDDAFRALRPSDPGHRQLSASLMALMTELEKPWAIKTAQEQQQSGGGEGSEGARSGSSSADAEVDVLAQWKQATVAWVADIRRFCPVLLPRMHVPADRRTDGVYDSAEQYFETVGRLWTAVTFSEGCNALNPACHSREGSPDRPVDCGHVLWPVADAMQQQGPPLRCRTRGCINEVAYACFRKNHNYGLCETCAERARGELRGPPGPRACTHIYDCTVGSKVDWDGRVTFKDFASRKPPAIEVHWNSSKRLSTSNLIGVVKIASRGAALNLSDHVVWGEIVLTDRQQDRMETAYRAEKMFTAALLQYSLALNQSPAAAKDGPDLQPGDSVAVIDFRTFVPEYVNVLAALEAQKRLPLPFNNLGLLNMSRKHHLSAPASTISPPRAEPEGAEQSGVDSALTACPPSSEIEHRIDQMLRASTLEPIVQCRAKAYTRLRVQLTSLVGRATMDPGQFESFLAALTHPVHCTQGPPGTGKSYLGVVLAKAMLILRREWVAVRPDVGAPPLLVLSYKNHAIDEFLVDLLNSCSSRLGLIRIGSQSQREELRDFGERSLRSNDQGVRDAKGKLETIARLHDQCKTAERSRSRIVLTKVGPSDTETREGRAKVNALAIEISKTLVCLQTACNLLQTTAGAVSGIGSAVADLELPATATLEQIEPILKQYENGSGLVYAPISSVDTLRAGIQHYDSCTEAMDVLSKWIVGFVPRPRCSYADEDEGQCSMIAQEGSAFCREHSCLAPGCNTAKSPGATFCENHACQMDECANQRLPDPQLYCSDHCCFACLQRNPDEKALPAQDEPPRNVCENHPLCVALVRGAPCNEFADPATHCCKDHCLKLVCRGRTKKNKPCKSRAISTAIPYCKDHRSQAPKHAASTTQSPPVAAEEAVSTTPDVKLSVIRPSGEGEEAEAAVDQEKNDNPDEREEESEYVQHIREVYEMDKDEDDVTIPEPSDEDYDETARMPADSSSKSVALISPSKWTWEMTLEQRWEQIECLVDKELEVLRWAGRLLARAGADARAEYNQAKVAATSRMYQRAEVIGGTIVGCIGRLEAIRATNPFAIVVEEASEVSEPLLFACLGPSTVKIEMIGDHLQLQPSIQDRFDFERINNMTVSMFERLVTAPPKWRVPMSVLSVQRRMRPSICDLTRLYYDGITKITDHPKAIRRTLELTVSDIHAHRDVPGIQPHLFFLEHSGKEQGSSVGVSKQNPTEAELVSALCKYMVSCGVNPSSIAVITPYKGQMKLLQRKLEDARVRIFRDPSRSCQLSTVDRFQGDEADVVVVSLVTDEKTRSQFVTQRNRMIVALSRARVAMFVVGNKGYFEHNQVEHWKKTFEILSKHAKDDAQGIEDREPEDFKLGFCTVPIAYALDHYRCAELELVMKPCLHEERIACYLAQAYISGRKEWPNCTQPAHQPLVRAECKHLFNCACFEYDNYKNMPELIPKCRESVEYIPPCGHAVTVQCFLKQLYDQTPDMFVCKKTLQVSLPRCGHVATVPCPDAMALAQWQGRSCEKPGVVLEGTEYGPTDYICDQTAEFVLKCGHASQMPCQRAFTYAQKSPTCTEMVTAVDPRCGHEYSMPCRDAQLSAKTRRTQPPVEAVWEDKLDSTFAHPASPLWTAASRCAHPVELHRTCGHVETALCGDCQRATLAPCQGPTTVAHPVCGHAMQVLCSWSKEHSGLKCWSDTFMASPPYKQFVEQHVLCQGMEIPNTTGIPKCTAQVTVQRSCGHRIQMCCSKAIEALSSWELVVKPCQETVDAHLECGHVLQVPCSQYERHKVQPFLVCNEPEERKCWNFDKCGCYAQALCSDTGIVSCSTETQWVCPKGHRLSARFCEMGFPSACPSCSKEAIESEIDRLRDEAGAPESPEDAQLPPALRQVSRFFTPLALEADFADRLLSLLQQYAEWADSLPEWERPLAGQTIVPCFCVPRSTASCSRPVTNTGILSVSAFAWTRRNLEQLLSRFGRRTAHVSVVAGYGVCCRALSDACLPPGKGRQQWASQQRNSGYDLLFSDKGGSLLFLHPFCFRPTHIAQLSKADLECIFPLLPEAFDADLLKEERISFNKKESSGQERSQLPQCIAKPPPQCLEGTVAEGIPLLASWNGSLPPTGNTFGTPGQETELWSKLSFSRDAVGIVTAPPKSPFAGVTLTKGLLHRAKRGSTGHDFLRLLLCLEFAHHKQAKEARAELLQYATAASSRKPVGAHPLLLLAVARAGGVDNLRASACIAEFAASYPDAAVWLTSKEQQALSRAAPDRTRAHGVGSDDGPVEGDWKELKEREGCSSESMEKLLRLTGLLRVKRFALGLFKSAVAFKKMTREAQAKNQGSLSLNFAFVGNPGTGKTTVARLVAGILHDSGMRRCNAFVECKAQKVKDDGVNMFRDLVARAQDGVLFVDEAYELDPRSDGSGRPIVAEILTLAEDHREHISVILAGYQDDVASKLYAYNEGMKSRFQEVVFDDYSPAELREIWDGMAADRLWTADAAASDIIIRRLSRGANRKGFANARSVRCAFEAAIQSAMSRPGWSGDRMHLCTEDIIGECPSETSPRVAEVLREFDGMTGWASVKRAAREVVELARRNWELERQGRQPLPIFLNRLFLGNPGTGKTTCARLYGRLLKALGVLSVGDVVAKTASDFVGQFIGQSQNRTTDILRLAQGKVLVIDEAYNLADSGSTYGRQVLDTIVEKVQGGPWDDIAVLLLGYEPQMAEMLRTSNPGLARRFPLEYAFRFDDYTDEELLQIFAAECERKGILLESYRVAERAIEHLAHQRVLPNFGNAGAVETLIRAAGARAAQRSASSSEQLELTVEDVDEACSAGGAPESESDPYAPLRSLYNVQNIVEQLRGLQARLEVAKREGEDAPEVGNFVFLGNPGTGKTTVARALARMLHGLELLATDRVEETSALSLTGEFVGHTKKRVGDALDRARGGVLFIDEAYELGRGHFGQEAMTALVEGMTSQEHRSAVVVVAGYREQMNAMLDRNPGLRSRFRNFVEFSDWEPRHCVEFLRGRAASESYALGEDAVAALLEGFGRLRAMAGWGNARDTIRVWDSVIEERAKRVHGAPEEGQRCVLLSDVSAALLEVQRQRATPRIQVIAVPLREDEDEGELQAEQSSEQEQDAPCGSGNQQRSQQSEEAHSKGSETSDSEPDVDKETDDEGEAPRDSGVTDEQWAELERAKRDRRERTERLRAEHERGKLLEEQRKQNLVRERLQRIAKCPMGFDWYRVGGGWRCAGGAHFVTDEQLASQFGTDE
eukprot:m51a1_g9139 hypothetical protein (3447) ;mRNA; r:63647-74936